MMLVLVGGIGLVLVVGLLMGVCLCRVAAGADEWTEQYAEERQAWRETRGTRPDDESRRAA